MEDIVAGTGYEPVVPIAAVERVVALTTIEDVIAAIAVDEIIQIGAHELVRFEVRSRRHEPPHAGLQLPAARCALMLLFSFVRP